LKDKINLIKIIQLFSNLNLYDENDKYLLASLIEFENDYQISYNN